MGLLPPPYVNKKLRARTAWSGISHLPEVVAVAHAVDAGGIGAGDFTPETPCFVVAVMHREIQTVGMNAEIIFAGHPLPGELDGLLLEVVAEGKIPQHLEEGVVPGGVAHLLQVVVLSTGTNAFLRGHRPVVIAVLESLEHALVLHHPRVGEQQRGIVGGHEGRRRIVPVAAIGEVVDEGLANLG